MRFLRIILGSFGLCGPLAFLPIRCVRERNALPSR
jgi:hypothetical protein